MLKEYTKYMCLTKSFFGGWEPATIEDFREAIWAAEDEGGDPDGHIAAWLRNGSIVVTLGDTNDYRSVTEWKVADAGLLTVATNQGNLIESFREVAKDARDEDVWAIIKQISNSLESRTEPHVGELTRQDMNDAIITVNAVAQFFGIGEPRLAVRQDESVESRNCLVSSADLLRSDDSAEA